MCLLLVLVFALGHSNAIPATSEGAATQDVGTATSETENHTRGPTGPGSLWLQERTNLTGHARTWMTLAPTKDSASVVFPLTMTGVASGNRAETSAGMLPLAENWTVEPGDSVEVVLWLDFHDDMIPVWGYEPPGTMDDPPEETAKDAAGHVKPGEAALRVRLVGALSGTEVAVAESRWLVSELPTGVNEVALSLVAEEGLTFPRGPNVDQPRFWIEWEGARRAEYNTGPDLLFGSKEHPTRVAPEGFPWEAMHAHESALVEAARCRAMALDGEACASTDPDADQGSGEDGAETNGAPGPGGGLLSIGLVTLALAAAAAGRVRRRAG